MISKTNRRACARCRLDKCFQVGMKQVQLLCTCTWLNSMSNTCTLFSFIAHQEILLSREERRANRKNKNSSDIIVKSEPTFWSSESCSAESVCPSLSSLSNTSLQEVQSNLPKGKHIGNGRSRRLTEVFDLENNVIFNGNKLGFWKSPEL